MQDDTATGPASPVSRRAFVGAALATGALAATNVGLPVIAGAEPDDAMRAGTTTNAKQATARPAFALEEATIADLQRLMTAGQHTSRSLCQAYLARIAEIDRKGPALRAVIELNPDALTIADAMDAERKAVKSRGAVHGIRVMIKDNIATADESAFMSVIILGSSPRAPPIAVP